MTELTTKARKQLDAGQFALPGRRYPVEDAAHATNAKARAEQQFEKGGLSAAEKKMVDRKADSVLAKKNK